MDEYLEPRGGGVEGIFFKTIKVLKGILGELNALRD